MKHRSPALSDAENILSPSVLGLVQRWQPAGTKPEQKIHWQSSDEPVPAPAFPCCIRKIDMRNGCSPNTGVADLPLHADVILRIWRQWIES